MSRNPFIPLPPTFIGGRQPHAPPLGVPQSAPAAQPAPLPQRILALISQAWEPRPAEFVGGPQPYQPRRLTPPSGPAVQGPPIRQAAALLALFAEAWQPAYALPPRVQIAALIPVAVASVQPAPSLVNSRIIASSWEQPALPMAARSLSAALIRIDDPPRCDQTRLNTILQSWYSSASPLPARTRIAAVLQSADAPPGPGKATLSIVLRSWEAQPAAPQSAGHVPQAVTPATQIPVSLINQGIIAAAWLPAPSGLPTRQLIAAISQRTDAPPPPKIALQALILRQWDPEPSRFPVSGKQAPLIPSAVPPDAPPVRTRTVLYTVLDTWLPKFVYPQAKVPVAANIIPIIDTSNYVIVPYLIGDTEAAARARIASIYCIALVTGSSGTVTSQDPPHMSLVMRGVTISITLGGDLNNIPVVRRPVEPTYGKWVR